LNAFVWSIFVNYFPSIAQYFILFTQDPTLARYIFCLPTTRGSNEKFIVKPGDIIQPRRTLLDCADPEKLIFCHENYFQLRPFVSSWELDDAEYISGSDTSGSSLSDSELGDEPGNSDTRY